MKVAKSTTSEPKVLRYELQENGYYLLIECPIGFNKLPNELIIELTQRHDLIANGAKIVLRGRIKGGNYTFFTGLRHLNGRTFYGNKVVSFRSKKWRILIIVKVSNDNRFLTLIWTNKLYQRTSQIVDLLQEI